MKNIQKSELCLLAVDVAGDIQSGNFRNALGVLTLLNSMQTIVFYEHLKTYLSQLQYERFLELVTQTMNDQEYLGDMEKLGRLLNTRD